MTDLQPFKELQSRLVKIAGEWRKTQETRVTESGKMGAEIAAMSFELSAAMLGETIRKVENE